MRFIKLIIFIVGILFNIKSERKRRCIYNLKDGGSNADLWSSLEYNK